MSMPFLSVTMLRALFGHLLPSEEAGAETVAEPRRGGDEPGRRRAWLADDRGSQDAPDNRIWKLRLSATAD